MSDIQLRRLLYSFRDANLRCQNRALKFSVENADRAVQSKIGIGIRIHLLRQLLTLAWLVGQPATSRLSFGLATNSLLVRVFSLVGFVSFLFAWFLHNESKSKTSRAGVSKTRVSRGQAKLISPLRKSQSRSGKDHLTSSFQLSPIAQHIGILPEKLRGPVCKQAGSV